MTKIIKYFCSRLKGKSVILLQKFILGVFILISLTGCDGDFSWCLTTASDAYISDSVTQRINTNVEVNATGVDSSLSTTFNSTYGQWVTSNVTILKGDTVTIGASGNIVLAPPYGLIPKYNVNPVAPGVTPDSLAAYNSMSQGTFFTSSGAVSTSGKGYYDNNGYGTQYVVSPSNAGLVQINTITSSGAVSKTTSGNPIAFPFVNNQRVVMTLANCQTGDQSSATPTKWTWNGGWVYYGINCKFKNKNRNFTTDCSYDANPQQCKAVKKCTALYWYAWKCSLSQQTFVNYNDPVFTNQSAFTGTYNTDVCPSSSQTSPSFDCASNNSDPSKLTPALCGSNSNDYSCGGSGFCGGKDNGGTFSVAHSNKSPGCGFRDGYLPGSTSPDTCGTSDTCWNTNGFRLYAVQNNVTSTCASYPVNSNCIHLYGAQASAGGANFNANGGKISLVIADPNAGGGTDVASLQTQYNNNQVQIETYANANTALEPIINSTQYTLNAFAGADCSQVSTMRDSASQYASSLSSTDSAISNSFTNIYNSLGYVYNDCVTLSSQVLSSYSSATPNPWSSTLTSLTNRVSTAQGYANSLNTSSSANSDPSSTDIASFKSSLINYLSLMQTNIGRFSQYSIPSLRSSASSYLSSLTVSDAMKTAINNVLTTINSIQTYLNNGDWTLSNYSQDSFNKQISNDYNEFNETITTSTWYNNLNSNIIPLISTLQTQMSALTDPSVSDYKNLVNTVYLSLNNYAISLSNNALTYYNNQQLINDLTTTNDNLSASINRASSSTGGYTGGYTVYVKADPVVASNGEYLSVILSEGDPNNIADATYPLTNTNCDVSSAGGCTAEAINSGTIWFKINDPDGVYYNNSGSYNVTVTQYKTTNGFGRLFSDIISKFSGLVTQIGTVFVRNLVCTNQETTFSCWDFLRSIHIILVLYVVIFGIMFLFGLIQINYLDFLIRVIKIAVIIMVTGPRNAQYLYTYVFQAFSKLSAYLIAISTGQDPANAFGFLGQSVGALLLDDITYFKIFSLIFQGKIGIIVFVILIMAIFKFASAVFNAFKIFIMSFLGLGICFVLSPFFICFILFDKTRYLFDNWFKSMIKFTIEPVILFIGLIIINALLVSLIQQIFNFSACFKCVIPFSLYLPGIFTLGDGTLFCFPGFGPWGMDNLGSGSPFAIFLEIPLVLSFYMTCSVLDVYSDSMARDISNAIFGQKSSTSFGSGSGRTMMDNPFEDQIKNIRNITGTRDKDFARRSQVRADDLINRLNNLRSNDSGASAQVGTSTRSTSESLSGNNDSGASVQVGASSTARSVSESSSGNNDLRNVRARILSQGRHLDQRLDEGEASRNINSSSNYQNNQEALNISQRTEIRQIVGDAGDIIPRSINTREDKIPNTSLLPESNPIIGDGSQVLLSDAQTQISSSRSNARIRTENKLEEARATLAVEDKESGDSNKTFRQTQVTSESLTSSVRENIPRDTSFETSSELGESDRPSVLGPGLNESDHRHTPNVIRPGAIVGKQLGGALDISSTLHGTSIPEPNKIIEAKDLVSPADGSAKEITLSDVAGVKSRKALSTEHQKIAEDLERAIRAKLEKIKEEKEKEELVKKNIISGEIKTEVGNTEKDKKTESSPRDVLVIEAEKGSEEFIEKSEERRDAKIDIALKKELLEKHSKRERKLEENRNKRLNPNLQEQIKEKFISRKVVSSIDPVSLTDDPIKEITLSDVAGGKLSAAKLEKIKEEKEKEAESSSRDYKKDLRTIVDESKSRDEERRTEYKTITTERRDTTNDGFDSNLKLLKKHSEIERELEEQRQMRIEDNVKPSQFISERADSVNSRNISRSLKRERLVPDNDPLSQELVTREIKEKEALDSATKRLQGLAKNFDELDFDEKTALQENLKLIEKLNPRKIKEIDSKLVSEIRGHDNLRNIVVESDEDDYIERKGVGSVEREANSSLDKKIASVQELENVSLQRDGKQDEDVNNRNLAPEKSLEEVESSPTSTSSDSAPIYKLIETPFNSSKDNINKVSEESEPGSVNLFELGSKKSDDQQNIIHVVKSNISQPSEKFPQINMPPVTISGEQISENNDLEKSSKNDATKGLNLSDVVREESRGTFVGNSKILEELQEAVKNRTTKKKIKENRDKENKKEYIEREGVASVEIETKLPIEMENIQESTQSNIREVISSVDQASGGSGVNESSQADSVNSRNISRSLKREKLVPDNDPLSQELVTRENKDKEALDSATKRLQGLAKNFDELDFDEKTALQENLKLIEKLNPRKIKEIDSKLVSEIRGHDNLRNIVVENDEDDYIERKGVGSVEREANSSLDEKIASVQELENVSLQRDGKQDEDVNNRNLAPEKSLEEVESLPTSTSSDSAPIYKLIETPFNSSKDNINKVSEESEPGSVNLFELGSKKSDDQQNIIHVVKSNISEPSEKVPQINMPPVTISGEQISENNDLEKSSKNDTTKGLNLSDVVREESRGTFVGNSKILKELQEAVKNRTTKKKLKENSDEKQNKEEFIARKVVASVDQEREAIEQSLPNIEKDEATSYLRDQETRKLSQDQREQLRSGIGQIDPTNMKPSDVVEKIYSDKDKEGISGSIEGKGRASDTGKQLKKQNEREKKLEEQRQMGIEDKVRTSESISDGADEFTVRRGISSVEKQINPSIEVEMSQVPRQSLVKPESLIDKPQDNLDKITSEVNTRGVISSVDQASGGSGVNESSQADSVNSRNISRSLKRERLVPDNDPLSQELVTREIKEKEALDSATKRLQGLAKNFDELDFDEKTALQENLKLIEKLDPGKIKEIDSKLVSEIRGHDNLRNIVVGSDEDDYIEREGVASVEIETKLPIEMENIQESTQSSLEPEKLSNRSQDSLNNITTESNIREVISSVDLSSDSRDDKKDLLKEDNILSADSISGARETSLQQGSAVSSRDIFGAKLRENSKQSQEALISTNEELDKRRDIITDRLDSLQKDLDEGKKIKKTDNIIPIASIPDVESSNKNSQDPLLQSAAERSEARAQDINEDSLTAKKEQTIKESKQSSLEPEKLSNRLQDGLNEIIAGTSSAPQQSSSIDQSSGVALQGDGAGADYTISISRATEGEEVIPVIKASPNVKQEESRQSSLESESSAPPVSAETASINLVNNQGVGLQTTASQEVTSKSDNDLTKPINPSDVAGVESRKNLSTEHQKIVEDLDQVIKSKLEKVEERKLKEELGEILKPLQSVVEKSYFDESGHIISGSIEGEGRGGDKGSRDIVGGEPDISVPILAPATDINDRSLVDEKIQTIQEPEKFLEEIESSPTSTSSDSAPIYNPIETPFDSSKDNINKVSEESEPGSINLFEVGSEASVYQQNVIHVVGPNISKTSEKAPHTPPVTTSSKQNYKNMDRLRVNDRSPSNKEINLSDVAGVKSRKNLLTENREIMDELGQAVAAKVERDQQEKIKDKKGGILKPLDSVVEKSGSNENKDGISGADRYDGRMRPIKTPYRKVINSKVTKEIVYLSKSEESKYIIAPLDTKLNKNEKFKDFLVRSRKDGEYMMTKSNNIQLMEIPLTQNTLVADPLVDRKRSLNNIADGDEREIESKAKTTVKRDRTSDKLDVLEEEMYKEQKLLEKSRDDERRELTYNIDPNQYLDNTIGEKLEDIAQEIEQHSIPHEFETALDKDENYEKAIEIAEGKVNKKILNKKVKEDKKSSEKNSKNEVK